MRYLEERGIPEGMAEELGFDCLRKLGLTNRWYYLGHELEFSQPNPGFVSDAT